MAYDEFAHATFNNALDTLDLLIARAQETGLSHDMLATRLTPDMFPLELQIRVALNQVLLALRQVGQRQVPLEEAPYASWVDAAAAVKRVRAQLLDGEAPPWADAKETVDLTLPNGVRFVMGADDDICDWIVPNLYFHLTMTYALLRQSGLALGKMDFLPHMARHRAEPPGE